MPPEGAAVSAPLRLSLLTTWHEQCGIATYSEALAEGLAEHGVQVSVVAPKRPAKNEPRGTQPVRVWNRSRAGLLDAARTFREIQRQRAQVVHIQHTMGIAAPAWLLGVTRRCARAGIPVVVTLHEMGGGSLLRRFEFGRTLFAARGATLVVHAADQAVPGAEVIPHGILEVSPQPREAARSKLGIPDDALVIAHFGFIHPDKGIEEVLEAVAQLRSSRFPTLRYRVCGAPFANAKSQAHFAHLRQRSAALGLGDAVDLSGTFASEEHISQEMNAADLVVLNYRTGNRQGASGAASRALANGSAVALSQAPIFDGLRPACHTLGPALQSELEQLLASPEKREKLASLARDFCADRRWPLIAGRHAELYRRLRAAHPVP